MAEPEQHHFCLDCWQESKPAFKKKRPAKQVGSNDLTEITHEANSIWSAHGHDGFKCLVLYEDVGDAWEERQRWE